MLARPVDLVIATTGVGFRGWLEAADAWDLPLVEHLRPARVMARGPKARGAIRGGGLVDAWSPESESSAEVLVAPALRRRGAAGGTADRRPAARRPAARPGRPGCGDAGAEVLTVPVYRWVLPEDVAPVRRLVASIVAGSVDAVTFTSAPAAASLLTVADELGQRDALVAAMKQRVLAVAVGSGDGRPAGGRRHPDPPAGAGAAGRTGPGGRRPAARAGPGAADRRRTHCRCVGTAASLDGRSVELAPGPWRCCARSPAGPAPCVSRAELIASLPGGGDGHAVEMAVTRLRAALGAPVVETVVKRGYRLKL